MQPSTLPATALLAVVSLCPYVASQTPQLVADINKVREPLSSLPSGGDGTGLSRSRELRRFTVVGNVTYFRAYTRTHGVELYRTLGTTGSTTRLTDLNPGGGNSDPNYLATLGTRLFFSATGPRGNELYVLDTSSSNPTASLVADIEPGGDSSPWFMTAYNGFVYFSAWTSQRGRELWRSDGTAANTTRVKDILPGTNGSFPDYFTVYKGLLYFAASAGVGRELWRTDGTAAGTVQVADIQAGPGDSWPLYLSVYKNDLYFMAYTTSSGAELFKWDGTRASLVHDLMPGAEGGEPGNLTEYRGYLYFTARTPNNGVELCRTDGSNLTVFDLNPGSEGSRPRLLELVGTGSAQKLAMQAFGRSVGTEPVFHDGVTSVFVDVMPGSPSSAPGGLLGTAAGKLYFGAMGTSGDELWSSDGTQAGTAMVKDISPGTASSFPRYLTANPVGGFLFSASDGSHGVELWASDGTAAGTRLVADLNRSSQTLHADLSHLVDAHGTAYFSATDGATGRELWRSDGTAAGTRLVRDLDPGRSSSSPSNLLVIGNRLFFTASTASTGIELHCLNLVDDGITTIDIRPGTGSSSPFYLTEFQGECYFQADDGTRGIELWRSDGTVAGTRLVRDILPGSAGSSPAFLAAHKGRLYFSAAGPANGSELWVTDGTSTGTREFLDIQTGSQGSSPEHMTSVADLLVFRASTTATGSELYASDGTRAGTRVFDIRTGAQGSSPSPARPMHGTHRAPGFLAIGDKVYFNADDGVHGSELFVFDGSRVALTRDIRVGSESSGARELARLGDRVVFLAWDGVTGGELWISDGTSAGTMLVKDINPGSLGSVPFRMTPIGQRRALFVALTYGTGMEPYVTDGTAAGTMLLADIHPGPEHSVPDYFTTVGGLVLFQAAHPQFGIELFKVDFDGTAYRYSPGCSASGIHPVFDASDPVIGSNVTLNVRNAVPNRAGVALVGMRALPGRVIALPTGCSILVDATLPTIGLFFTTGATGTWSVSLPIPNDPNVVGTVSAAQAGIGPTANPLLGLDLTNLLVLDVGR